MNKKALVGLLEKRRTLRAVLLLRLMAVFFVVLALPARGAIPLWMAQWYRLISYPLFFYNSALMIFHKKITAFFQKHPTILLMDLAVSVGIMQIGGGWRSSYFVYTLTTIMLFTIFDGKKGAYVSSVVLAVGAVIKDPVGGLPAFDIFSVSGWDMRIGTSIFYITAGCILAYFRTLLDKLEAVSKAKIEETRKVAAMEEKMRIALNLHDGVKSKFTAILLVLKPLLNKAKFYDQEIEKELGRLWQWMNFLQIELDYIVNSLKSKEDINPSTCNIVKLTEQEAKIIEDMTGFSWKISCSSPQIDIPLSNKEPLMRFLSEALMNSCKHSGTTTGTIDLKLSKKSITIIISDYGRGCTFSDRIDTGTTGLKSLQYRAKELNGTLVIQTKPGEGFKLFLTFPAKASITELGQKS